MLIKTLINNNDARMHDFLTMHELFFLFIKWSIAGEIKLANKIEKATPSG